MNRLPTFSELVKFYGPYLGLVVSLVIIILLLQFVWFNRILKAKNKEIERLVDREEKLSERVNYMIDHEIGYRKKAK